MAVATVVLLFRQKVVDEELEQGVVKFPLLIDAPAADLGLLTNRN